LKGRRGRRNNIQVAIDGEVSIDFEIRSVEGSANF
jgi:hypothetical protein